MAKLLKDCWKDILSKNYADWSNSLKLQNTLIVIIINYYEGVSYCIMQRAKIKSHFHQE